MQMVSATNNWAISEQRGMEGFSSGAGLNREVVSKNSIWLFLLNLSTCIFSFRDLTKMTEDTASL